MATRVKAKSKIGKRLKARQKAGKSTSLAIGPGAVGNIMKGSKMGKALADTLKKLRAEAKARIAARAKTKPVPLPEGVKPKQFSIAEAQAKLKPQSKLVGDLTKKKTSELSAADQVRQASQLSRKRVKEGRAKVPRKSDTLSQTPQAQAARTAKVKARKAAQLKKSRDRHDAEDAKRVEALRKIDLADHIRRIRGK